MSIQKMLIVRLISLVALSFPSAVFPQRSGDRRRDVILKLEEQWRSAQHHNDTATFDRLLAPDVTFVGTSGSLRTKEGFIASRLGSWIPRATAYVIEDLVVRFYVETAIVTGIESTTGEGVAFKGRFTHVWAIKHGRWRLVAIQRTDIVPG